MRLRSRVVMVALANALVGIVACSSFSTAEPTSVPAEAGADTSSTVASGSDAAPGDVADAGGDAGTIDVVQNSGFETGSDCAGWSGSNATLVAVSPGYTGAQACRVCAVEGASSIFISQAVPRVAQLGQQLVASGYFQVREVDGVANPTLQLSTFRGGAQVEAAQAGLSTGSSFVNATTTLTPEQTYEAVGIAVFAVVRSSPGCFTVDDLELRASAVLAH